jgi:DNA-binding MarR family transcriptional regulator
MTEPRFGFDLLRLTRRCRGIDKYVSVRAALTIDEMHCLGTLYADQPASVKRLSELITVGSTRASKILKDLEARGLVSRSLDSSDRRKEHVYLTDAGRRAVERITELYAEVGSELLLGWRDELEHDLSWLLQSLGSSKVGSPS